MSLTEIGLKSGPGLPSASDINRNRNKPALPLYGCVSILKQRNLKSTT